MMLYWMTLVTLFTIAFFICKTNADSPCDKEKGTPHDCVNIEKCPTLYHELLKPAETRNNETLRRLFCGHENKMPKVCCPRKEHRNLYLISHDTVKIAGGEVADLSEFPWMALLSYRDDSPCDKEKGTPHDCVNIEKCPTLYNELLKPAETRNNETLRRLFCGHENKMPKVCCPRKEHRNLYLIPQHECGHDCTTVRIAGGEVAYLNEFPWMALLSYQDGKEIKFQCGGSLINDKYVLTAAHCINEYLLGVRIGEHNISESKDCVNYLGKEFCAEDVQNFNIAKTVVHEQFIRTALTNDIALIRLEGTVNMARANAKPICLPTTPYTKELELTNLTMTVTGWGATEDSKASDVLRKVNVQVVSNKDCRIASRRYQLCAGNLTNDACVGDSGGPLFKLEMVETNLVNVQFGIVSYGTNIKCGRAKHGIYTRVTTYMDWILDHLEP